MPDDKSKKGYQDRTRINTNESHEISYWTKKWRITTQQLIGAIRATESTSVKVVESYLKKNGKI